MAVEAFEGKYIVAAMTASKGNVTQASRKLGVHRNTLHNTEGGIDPEEDRVKKTVDRTNTLGSIVGALNAVGYRGWTSVEILPKPDPDKGLELGGGKFAVMCPWNELHTQPLRQDEAPTSSTVIVTVPWCVVAGHASNAWQHRHP